jgi:hypothetical protein
MLGGSLSTQHGASSGFEQRESLQLWREPANLLNKQTQTYDKGWFSGLEVGRRANNPNISLRLGRIPWKNDISDGIWTQDLGHGMSEVCIGQVH